MINTIIFDCDGVVLDSPILIQKALLSTVSNYIKTDDIDEYKELNFYDLNEELKRVGLTITAEMIEYYYTQLYHRMNNELTALLGQLILMLNKHQIKYCIASNSIRKQINYSLSLVNLKKHIADNRIFTVEQVSRGKPAPDLFLFSAQSIGSKPDECLVIEDSSEGIQAALAANMDVVAFIGGSHAQSASYQEKIKCYQIPIVKNEQELISLLRSEYKLNFIRVC